MSTFASLMPGRSDDHLYTTCLLSLHNFYISGRYPVCNFTNRRCPMKVVKFLLGLVAAMTLLVGGYTAGSFITQTRAASVPMLQSAQPTFIPQQQFQPTIVPRQPQATPAPQTTSPAIPPQGQWGRGWWMTLAPDASAGVDPNYVPQGEWERGWIMYPDFSSQGQRGWGMHDWGYDNCDGFYGGRGNGYGSQTNPNWNSTPTVPNTSPSYP